MNIRPPGCAGLLEVYSAVFLRALAFYSFCMLVIMARRKTCGMADKGPAGIRIEIPQNR